MSSEKEPGPGVTLFCIQREFKLTLEGYFVDKHLSSRIPTSFMKALVPHIEQGVKEEPQLFESLRMLLLVAERGILWVLLNILSLTVLLRILEK